MIANTNTAVNAFASLKNIMEKDCASYNYYKPFTFSVWQLNGNKYWPVGFFEMNHMMYFEGTFSFYRLNEKTGLYDSQYRTQKAPSSVKYEDNGKSGCYYFYYENGLMLAANL